MHFLVKLWQLACSGLIVVGCWLLAACAEPPPTPTPLLPTATDTPTLSPSPRAVASTLAPTFTPSATATATPGRTPTPTSTPTPTATPAPTFTPTPTPQPHLMLEIGIRHQTNGDYAQAIDAYLALLRDDPSPEQAREARYRLAECYQLDRDYQAAAAAWENFLGDYADDGRLPQIHLMLAHAYDAAGQCAQAAPYYQAYVDADGTLADLAHEASGDCLAAAADFEGAIAAYRAGLAATADASVQVSLREKIAGAYLALDDLASAVAEYEVILDVARQDWYRAKIEYLAGQALAAAGQTEAAHTRYRRAFESYPEAEYAYLSLVELVNAGVEVDEFQRGLVDYYAGAAYPDAYGAAIRAFDRYLAAEPAPRADEALFRKALAQRALEQPDAALETLEALLVGYPQSEWLTRAWLEKAGILAGLGEIEQAVKAYQDTAAFFPAAEGAPVALWRAAKLREGEPDHAEAARLFTLVQATFPAYENADEALWRAGLAQTRAGNLDGAIAAWQALLVKYPQSVYRPKTLYWLGKLGAEPPAEGETGYWDQLVAADPHAYYALRVELIRAGESLTATRLITAAVEPPAWQPAKIEAEILDWLRSWTQVPAAADLNTLPITLTRRTDFQRAEVLLAVNQRTEALAAFDGARAAAWGKPVWLAQLAFYFHDRGLHGLAARCATRLAGLRPSHTVHDAPAALQRLAYPLPYADLLSAESAAQGLDPLLLAALVRQESLFEPAAESYAGARGLGQVMPATGEGIARSLKLESFVLDDLYRPWVSIRFGAFYLAVQMNRFDHEILKALAAYNGGPGNTLYWLELTGEGDLDLFVELITATQSRLYLQRVYEQYLVYETLYRPQQDG